MNDNNKQFNYPAISYIRKFCMINPYMTSETSQCPHDTTGSGCISCNYWDWDKYIKYLDAGNKDIL